MSITSSIALCLSIVMADPEVHDKVVTLTTAPVMDGSEKLAEVQPGVELTVTDVQMPWVGVTVTQDGKEVSGWILDKNVVVKSTISLKDLLQRGHLAAKQPEDGFKRIDRNGDGLVTVEEFVAGTRLPTLAELNQQLREVLGSGIEPGFPGAMQQAEIGGRISRFASAALEDSTSQLSGEQYGQILDLSKDFARTRDIRRNHTLLQIADQHDPKRREQRAQIAFAVADTNADNGLSIEEFTSAWMTRNTRTSEKRMPKSAHPFTRPSTSTKGTGSKITPQARRLEVERLITQLKDPDRSSRTNAARILANMEAKEAIPDLEEAVKDAVDERESRYIELHLKRLRRAP